MIDPFYLSLSYSSDSEDNPGCQVITQKISNRVKYSIYPEKKALNLIQIENITYIVYKA